MNIKIKDIKKLLVDTLLRYNVSNEDAEIIADECLEGEIQGKPSHGLMAFPALVEKLPFEYHEPIVRRKTKSYIFVDAQKNFGAVVGRKYAYEAIKMAEKQGVAVVLIRNMLSWLRPASIAQYVAEHNMIGFVVNGGGNPMIAPPGGYEPRTGTNPIGIGIPTDGHDILVDMATSKRAWGEVRKAKFNKTDLPADTYLNNQGEFTLDPDAAISVVAAGDYKGFALSLFIEILTGSLIEMPMNQQGTKNEDYRTLSRGAMIFIINPNFSTSVEKFRKANAVLADQIRNSKTRKGCDEIFLPGDRAAAKKKQAEKNASIEISEQLWKTLSGL